MTHHYFDKTELENKILNFIGIKNISIHMDITSKLDAFDLINLFCDIDEEFDINIKHSDLSELPEKLTVSDIIKMLDEKYGIHNNLYLKIHKIKKKLNNTNE